MNKTLLIGRLTATPELTQTPTGKNVTHVTVARFTKNNSKRLVYCYFRCAEGRTNSTVA